MSTTKAGDGMLPGALVPHAKEWYRLCERRFAVERITISGELAEAIVEAVCAPTPPASQPAKGDAVLVAREPPFPKQYIASGVRTENGDRKTVYLRFSEEAGGWHQWDGGKANAKRFDTEEAALAAARSAPGSWYCMPEAKTITAEPVEHAKAKQYRAMLDAGLAAAPAPAVCTCPSGDGSLRWPCPAHPCVTEEWQPIATAPKDGRVVMLFDLYGELIGHWCSHSDAWLIKGGGNFWGPGGFPPALWRPMPPYPCWDTLVAANVASSSRATPR